MTSNYDIRLRSRRLDKYANFCELASTEVLGKDYRIEVSKIPSSKGVVIAPHGDKIEPGTSTIARRAAGADFSFYLFEGIKKSKGNGVLHITSHHFNEKKCIELVEKTLIVVAIHGCKGRRSRICIGGLDRPLKEYLSTELSIEGLPVVLDCPEFLASEPMNICNRSARKCGAQLEISPDLRKEPYIDRIAAAVHRAIEARSGSLQKLAC